MTSPRVLTPAAAVRSLARPLTGGRGDYDAMLELVGERRVVLLGEATHGTREFYRMRAEITRRLIEEKGFDAVAVEADWPDAYRLNRHVRGASADDSAVDAFSDFRRFPLWMWRNAEVLRFIGWLREYNQTAAWEHKAGFYGLDLYSLFRSAEEVVRYLDAVDPEAADLARRRYALLDHVGDAQYYGYTVALGQRESCAAVVAHQLELLRERSPLYLGTDGPLAEDEYFFAERNAHVVKDAEAYYRGMFSRRVNTWNLRDTHMHETLRALEQHLSREGRPARIVVWAHNSHLGDARATEMGRRGELNLGQLVRQQYGDDSLLVGFTTYTGMVSAASDWDGPVERKWIRPALEDSYEHLFYRSGHDRFFLPLCEEAGQALREGALERAIGVIYLPQTERVSHYFEASLSAQFDAVFHVDETEALEPLDVTEEWRRGESPETWPSGL